MLSLGAEIATYLQSKSPLGGTPIIYTLSPGRNLFVNGMPDTAETPELAIAIFESPGMVPVETLVGGGLAVSKVDRPNIQVRVRAPMGGYVTGNSLVNGIFGALQDVGGNAPLTAGGQTFLVIRALQSPQILPRDELERWGWAQNFQVTWINSQR